MTDSTSYNNSTSLFEENALMGREAYDYFKKFACIIMAMAALMGACNGLAVFQIGTLGLTIWFFYTGIKKVSLGAMLKMLITFHILVCLLALFIPDGVSAWDGETYEAFGRVCARTNDIWAYLMKVFNNQHGNLDRSDFGYTFVVGYCYYLFGLIFGPVVLWLIKLACHLATCALIYKLLNRFLEPEAALLPALIFGLNTGMDFWLLANLKESIFTFVVMGAVWWMYRLIEHKTLLNLGVFLLLAWISGLFRGSFPYCFAGAFCAYLALRYLHGFWTYVAVGGVFLITAFASSFISMVDASYLGQMEEADALFGGNNIVIRYLGPFLSPFPAMKGSNQIANTFIIGYAALNMSFAFFALMGMWKVIKLNQSHYFPVLFIFLLNAIMVIMTGFSINARFLYPVTPLYYLFIPIGLYYYGQKKLLMNWWMAGCLALTYLYNFR